MILVGVMHFMDPYNFDLESASRCVIHYAVQDGDVDSVRRLIASGLPLDDFDEIGRTPLHYAVVAESVEMAMLLLDAGAEVLIVNGADPTTRGWMQLTALDRASGRKRPEGRRVFELLQNAANR